MTTDELMLTPELRAWLLATARGLWPGNGRLSADDLAQEGWIAMWKVRDRVDEGGNPTAYMHQVARRRMVDVLREARYWTKAGRTPIGLEVPITPIDDGDSDVDASVKVWDALAIGDNIDALVLAYHEGEIWRAINELPRQQRDYVVLRFYRGMSDVEARATLGTNSNAVWSKAKVQLRDKLEHLVGV